MLEISDFKRMINGATYSEMYPQIDKPNVFSISTLSYAVQKQIDWKLNPKTHDFVNFYMWNGKCQHEYLQKRMKGGRAEVALEVKIETPLKSPFDILTLLGHVDYVSVRNAEAYEFKTSTFPNQRNPITDYMILQAGVYGYLLDRKYGRSFAVKIVKFNHDINEYVLTQEDKKNAWAEIERRAILCAETLSKYSEFQEVKR